MTHRLYSDEFKEKALQLYAQEGLNAAARQLAIDKKTILRWAELAGTDRREVTLAVSARNREAAAATAAKAERERAEARERIINRLVRLSEGALLREMEIIAKGDFSTDDLQALTNARMKAIQQLELLEGRATSRMDVGQERLIEQVVVAFRTALEVVPDALRDAVSQAFAGELRRQQELGPGTDDPVETIETGEVVEEDDA